VIAATELTSPAEGWPSPHRIALIELAESVRVLAIVDGEMPPNGARVVVVQKDDTYHARLSTATP